MNVWNEFKWNLRVHTCQWVWMLGNFLMLLFYALDSMLLRCEPCLQGSECPPCETQFMHYWPTGMLAWNSFMATYTIWRLMRNRKLTNRTFRSHK